MKLLKGYFKYFLRKLRWYLLTLVVAVMLNFFLPRMVPGNTIAAITNSQVVGMTDKSAIQEVMNKYTKQFGLDKSTPEQFVLYVKNLLKGDMGQSFMQYPKTVSSIISEGVMWTIALQLPAILVAWFLGNILGCVAAYMRGVFDKAILPAFLFIGNIPAFGMAVILLVVFCINLQWFPSQGGYAFNMTPHLSWRFFASVIQHYQMPFWSIVLVTIGGQAIGMRSMSIYELNADYVRYSRFLGIKDRVIVRYVFRNAMLPQITGLAMSLGTMIGGALVAEVVFSYPGLGSKILAGITGKDYPVISGCTLIITIMVLLANFIVEILYGVFDPRIKAAQEE